MINISGEGDLSISDLRTIFTDSSQQLTLSPLAINKINQAAAYVETIITSDQAVYGVNTGFGKLAHVKISPEKLKLLQKNLILSHAAGTGEFLETAIVRLIIAIKINSLARGFSGIRHATLENLMALYNHELYPCIPAKGSVGASGDLAPLAHLVLPLIGEGHCFSQEKIISGKESLHRARLKPLELAPKEGLALINGTQVSTAIALAALFGMEKIFSTALAAGALSLIAFQGSTTPFDPRIQQIRGQKGQQLVAEILRNLLQEYQPSGKQSSRVQDPYSFRCQPQVMGSCWDHLIFARDIFLAEANGVSDNPLIFVEDDIILTGGNFHAAPIAMAADMLALGIAEIGSIAERRIAALTDSHMSNLPAFLIHEAGLNSGLMLAHVTAASLVSENKSLAHPASVDNVPTSANQEDHVSMATFAANRLHVMLDNTMVIIAIELLAACQGIDLLQLTQLPPLLQQVKTRIRQEVAFYTHDSYLSPDIEKVKKLVKSGTIHQLIQKDFIL